jgi:hypothetical protein
MQPPMMSRRNTVDILKRPSGAVFAHRSSSKASASGARIVEHLERAIEKAPLGEETGDGAARVKLGPR